MKHNKALGDWGENYVSQHLAKNGYTIISRNTRTPFGEIDLVAQRDEITIFVEVKTRTTRQFGNPEDAISARKQSHMLDSASHYAELHNIDHWQLDVIAVFRQPDGQVGIEHFENILS